MAAGPGAVHGEQAMNTAPRTRPQPRQQATAECPQCRSLFAPRRPTQTFCGQKCRSDYHRDRGIEGQVASVRRISRGVSLVIHVAEPAEAALRLKLRDVVRVVP